MPHLHEDDYDGDSLIDPLDDGTLPLAPYAFDPLTEVRGLPWPNSTASAATFEYEDAHRLRIR